VRGQRVVIPDRELALEAVGHLHVDGLQTQYTLAEDTTDRVGDIHRLPAHVVLDGVTTHDARIELSDRSPRAMCRGGRVTCGAFPPWRIGSSITLPPVAMLNMATYGAGQVIGQ